MVEQAWRAKLQEGLSEAVRQIADRYRPERILVFGSMARGDFHEDSDIDLLIVKETDRKFLQRTTDVLELLDVDVPVEPLVYTPAELQRLANEGRDFLRTILEEAVLCYECSRQQPVGVLPVAPDCRT